MDKVILRNSLFEKYFDNKVGIEASDLVATLSFIPETWKKLHEICEDNIKYFDAYSYLNQCKIIHINQNNYLILKLRTLSYVIIDLNKRQNISKKSFENEFNSDFFIIHFNEPKTDLNIAKLCSINTFNKPEILTDFYFKNQEILNLSTSLKYQISIDNAWTYFFIDFVNASAQLGFQTLDQFLYEQLFLNYDLTASRMQDAQSKIGIEKMNEMFSKIKTIKIPIEAIPSDLYKQYNLQKKLTRKL